MNFPPYHYYNHYHHDPTTINAHYWASHPPFPHQQQTHAPIPNPIFHGSGNYQDPLFHTQHQALSSTQQQTPNTPTSFNLLSHNSLYQQSTYNSSHNTTFLLQQLLQSQQTCNHAISNLVSNISELNKSLPPSSHPHILDHTYPSISSSNTMHQQNHVTNKPFHQQTHTNTSIPLYYRCDLSNIQPQNDFTPPLPIIATSSSQPILDTISSTITISQPQQQNFTSYSLIEHHQSLSERELTPMVIPTTELPSPLLGKSVPPPRHVVLPVGIEKSSETTQLHEEYTNSSPISSPAVTSAVVEEIVLSKADGKPTAYEATRFIPFFIFDPGGTLTAAVNSAVCHRQTRNFRNCDAFFHSVVCNHLPLYVFINRVYNSSFYASSDLHGFSFVVFDPAGDEHQFRFPVTVSFPARGSVLGASCGWPWVPWIWKKNFVTASITVSATRVNEEETLRVIWELKSLKSSNDLMTLQTLATFKYGSTCYFSFLDSMGSMWKKKKSLASVKSPP